MRLSLPVSGVQITTSISPVSPITGNEERQRAVIAWRKHVGTTPLCAQAARDEITGLCNAV
jgi:hypothetical protein